MALESDPCRAGRMAQDEGVCDGPANAVKVADTYGDVAAGCVEHAAQLARQLRQRPGRGTIRVLPVAGGARAVAEVNRRASP